MADRPAAKAIPGIADFTKANGTAGEMYYFAYGVNMNQQHISALCSKPKVVAVAKLADHRLAFYGYSAIWDGARETVVPTPGHEVWGVVYDLSSTDREHLDDAQDARMDGSGDYFHSPVRVTGQQGELYPVLLYKEAKQGIAEKPSQEYLDFIIAGAVDRGLPTAYVEALRAIESKKAKYAVPRQKKSVNGISSGDGCSQCGDAAPDPSPIINISLGSPRSHS
jgi:hypothetical protein